MIVRLYIISSMMGLSNQGRIDHILTIVARCCFRPSTITCSPGYSCPYKITPVPYASVVAAKRLKKKSKLQVEIRQRAMWYLMADAAANLSNEECYHNSTRYSLNISYPPECETRDRRSHSPDGRPAGSAEKFCSLYDIINLEPDIETSESHQRCGPLNQSPRALGMTPKVVLDSLPKGRGYRIESGIASIAQVWFTAHCGCEDERSCCKAKGQGTESHKYVGGFVGCLQTLHTIEVRDQVRR